MKSKLDKNLESKLKNFGVNVVNGLLFTSSIIALSRGTYDFFYTNSKNVGMIETGIGIFLSYKIIDYYIQKNNHKKEKNPLEIIGNVFYSTKKDE